MNAEDAIISKKKKEAEQMEADLARHLEQGLCPKKPKQEKRRIETTRRRVRLQEEVSTTHP